jgi:hypothetical protein
MEQIRNEYTKFQLENLKVSDNLEDPGVDGSTLERIVTELGRECVDWNHPKHDRGQWRALVVINIWVP